MVERKGSLLARSIFLIGLSIVFIIIAFGIADAIRAPTTGPGPPGVIILTGVIVACTVYRLARKLLGPGTNDSARAR